MRGSRIITTAILVLMLAAVMGLRDVKAQTPVACEAVPFTTGWLALTVANTAPVFLPNGPNADELSLIYNAGLLGTVENFQGSVVAGLDWLYDNRQPNLETNMVGTQLVSWWTRKDGRNTIIQATNTNPSTELIDVEKGDIGSVPAPAVEGSVTVHVQILGEDCLELRNFCDSFTPLDTVVYDLSNLTSNLGQAISTGNLAEREGIIVITPVETCNIAAPQFNAVSWNFMQGNVKIINVGEDWEYGTNVRARTAAPPEPYFQAGAFFRNFVFNYYEAVNPNNCDGDNCAATALFKDFNSIGTNPGADLVLMSFGDYGLCGEDPSDSSGCGSFENLALGNFGTPGVYSAGPLTPATQFGPFAIFDDAENPESCPQVTGCFLRIGIDAGIPSTDDVTPAPPTPQCLLDPETGLPVDCNDPLCKPLLGCENPNTDPGLCEDGIDNDGVDGTDCADFGCDGFVDPETGGQCQSSGETSCDDGFDNDNNGFTDCGSDPDPNCVIIGACGSGTDSGSSGCTVAAVPVTEGTAAANFLLPLLPLAGVFAVRRIIRRRRK